MTMKLLNSIKFYLYDPIFDSYHQNDIRHPSVFFAYFIYEI